jgi:hypothetical protein
LSYKREDEKMALIDLRAISIWAIRSGKEKWWRLSGGHFGDIDLFVRLEDIKDDWRILLERIAQRIIAEKRRPNIVRLTASPGMRVWVFAVTRREVEWFSKINAPLKNVGARKEYKGKWWPVTEY